jgi:hypothetical protein
MYPYRRRTLPHESFPPIMFEIDRWSSNLDFLEPVPNLEKQKKQIISTVFFRR